ncbi:hypothetical protein WBJ53_18275 [Spirosoma sp. SC4-14]|uniref:mannitol dehydrogenase family protein n=1 Tax=Spirosoma sp. SC4-14 TaxID=3128900 RepID=UPI0030D460FB
MQTPIQDVLTESLFDINETLQEQFLQTSQTMLAYPALLAGYRTVQDSLSDPVFSNYLSVFVNHAVSALIPAAETAYRTAFTSELLTRLVYATDSLEDICADGASKLPEFLLPILVKLSEQNRPYCLAFLLAAYGHYLRTSVDDKGDPYAVSEPRLTETDWDKINDHDELSLLDIEPLVSANLRAIPHFSAAYKLFRKQIAIYGVSFTLRQSMCTFLELA